MMMRKEDGRMLTKTLGDTDTDSTSPNELCELGDFPKLFLWKKKQDLRATVWFPPFFLPLKFQQTHKTPFFLHEVMHEKTFNRSS